MQLLRKLFRVPLDADRETGPAGVRLDPDATRGGFSSRGDQAFITEAAALNAAGRHGEALSLIRQGLAAAPDDPDLLFARACALFEWGRHREAHHALLRAHERGFRGLDLFLRLGWSSLWNGLPDEGLEWLEKAVALAPDASGPHYAIGFIHHSRNRPDEASAAFERALALQPGNFDVLVSLATCHLDASRPQAAEHLLREAVAVNPDSANAWSRLGIALAAQFRDPEAFEAFQHAAQRVQVPSEDFDASMNLAINLRDTGRNAEALALFESFLPERPSIHGYQSYMFSLLMAGRLREGFSTYEMRWLGEPLVSLRMPFRAPAWCGQDLRGKTLVIRGEQGIGDMIQMLRFAPLVKALGATVEVSPLKGMEKLSQDFLGVDRVIDAAETGQIFDYFIQALSLPRVFGIELDTIPSTVPYLHARAELVARWALRLNAGNVFKVGLVWAGRPQHLRDKFRSLPLSLLTPLREVSGVQWYSLQKGPAGAEAETMVLPLTNLGPDLEDFCDTAAVIAQLDLVIAVDTSVAHLAGALGRPVWVLLPQPADWRWLEGRDDSPWYPSARLFRQRVRGDWAEVIGRVKTALREAVEQQQQVPRCVRDDTSSRHSEQREGPAVVVDPRQGAAPGVRPGFCGAQETRVGIMQYLPHDDPVGRSVDWYGEYLQPQLDLLAKFVRPGSTVLELGAGIGVHAVYLAELLGPAGHLLVVEPRPPLQSILMQNLAANRATNVTLVRGRVGGPREPEAAGATVDELQLEQLHLLKVLESGTGLAVLGGAGDTLWRLRPLLFLAAADKAELALLAHLAKEYSYRCWAMETALFNPDNFNRRNDDVFGGRRAHALLAIPEEIDVDITLEHCVEIA